MAGDTNNASNYTFAYSSELSGNADLISALGTEGFLAIDYIPPTDGSYFQLGIVLNYDNIFGQFFGGGAINNGDGTFTTLIPYEFFPDEIATYFQLGIIHNSDANEAYIVDNIRVVNLPEDADSLFTTQEDFAGFTSNDLLLSIDATDLDGSTIGGLATGGAAGTGGSILAGDSSSAYTFAFSSDLLSNQDFISALGTEGTIAFDHTEPSDGSYFQLGIVLNYDNHFDQFFGFTLDNGDGTFTTYVQYTFVPDDLATYFQLGFIHNSDSFDLYNVDNIRTVVDSTVLLGDVNCDGNVDLLDVTPFVDLLTSGGFDAKADVNQDGAVDLLDVTPFVALLTGG